MQVVKRDGRRTEFDSKCIENAVRKAAIADGWDELSAKNVAKRITERVTHDIEEEAKTPVDIEHIQDIVESVLMEKHQSVAKAYILYREKRTKMRRIKSKASVALVDAYLEAHDWRVKENSNTSFSLQGLNNYVASDISQEWWLNSVYNEDIRKAHISGDLHIHDLNLCASYCMGWSLQDILRLGFTGVPGKISSTPAKHFRTALGQICNFLFSVQGEASGAQAVSSFDTLLAPFIAHDNLDQKQVKQAIQEFIFNMNVPTRVGFQCPFTNITADVFCPKMYADEPVIIGGENWENHTYKEFQHEMDMLNAAYAEVMLEGDASGRPGLFPIVTYNVGKDFDWSSNKYDAVWKIMSKYGAAYIANYVNSDMNPEDARSLCCRLRLDNRELRKRGGGLFGSAPLTGSIGVVTLNMPRLAYDAQGDEHKFFIGVARLMDIAKDSLLLKRKEVERLADNGLYPYTAFYLKDVKARFGKYFANHFSTIGLVGVNEACLNLFGEDIASEKGQDFAAKVLDFMRDRIQKYQEDTGHLFNLEATPAEGTSFRLASLDKRSGRDMIFANGKAEEGKTCYYTNSTQLPVGLTSDVFKALDLQNDLQSKYTGGTVHHLHLGEEIKDPEVTKQLVKSICENYSIPYFTLSPTFSICPNDGYLSGKVEVCPKCGETTEVYARIVGYYRPVANWNEGKTQEFKERREFIIG